MWAKAKAVCLHSLTIAWGYCLAITGAASYTFKAVITIIVTGFVGAVWLGFKVLLGK
jgi:hypothetical protein